MCLQCRLARAARDAARRGEAAHSERPRRCGSGAPHADGGTARRNLPVDACLGDRLQCQHRAAAARCAEPDDRRAERRSHRLPGEHHPHGRSGRWCRTASPSPAATTRFRAANTFVVCWSFQGPFPSRHPSITNTRASGGAGGGGQASGGGGAGLGGALFVANGASVTVSNVSLSVNAAARRHRR